MARTFTAGFTTEKDKKANVPICFIQIDWPALPGLPALTIRLTDRIDGVSTDRYTVSGVDWFALVNNWSAISRSAAVDNSFQNPDPSMSVTVVNAPSNLLSPLAPFSDLFKTRPPEKARAIVYQWFGSAGLVSGDMVELHRGALADPVVYNERTCSFHIVETSNEIGRRLVGNVVSPDDYPLAPLEVFGKTLPIPIGMVKKAPMLSLRSAQRTRLTSAIVPGQVSITVRDTTNFPSIGVLAINDDEIAYTGKTATSFTGVSGINLIHNADSEVLERINDYIFGVDPQFPIKSIDQVYVEDDPASSADYIIDLPNNRVTFPNRPRFIKSVVPRIVTMQFDQAGPANTAINPVNAMDPGNVTSLSQLDETNSVLSLIQNNPNPTPDFGKITLPRLRVVYFMEEKLNSDLVDLWTPGDGVIGTLDNPPAEDKTTGAGSLESLNLNHDNAITTDFTGKALVHTGNLNFPFNEPIAGGHQHVVAAGGNDFIESQTASSSQTGPFAGTPIIAQMGHGGFIQWNFPSLQSPLSSGDKGADYTTSTINLQFTLQSIGGFGANGDTLDIYLGGVLWFTQIIELGVFTVTLNAPVVHTSTAASSIRLEMFKNKNQLFPDNVNLIALSFDTVLQRNVISSQGTNTNLSATGGFTAATGSIDGHGLSSVGGPTAGNVSHNNEPSPSNPAPVVISSEKSTLAFQKFFDLTNQVTMGGGWNWFDNREVQIRYNGTVDKRKVYILHAEFVNEFEVPVYEYSNNISFDGQGVKDNASGIITGTPDALIERPDHVFKWAFLTLLGEPTPDLDSASFSAAGTLLANAVTGGYKLSGVIGETREVREYWREWMKESRCNFYIERGLAKLKFRIKNELTGNETTVKSITEAMVKPGTIRIERTRPADIVNRINLKFLRDHRTGEYNKVMTFDDPVSQPVYGTRRADDFFQFNWTPSDSGAEAQADDIADFWLKEKSLPQIILSFEVFLEHLDIERFDLISVTHSFDSMIAVKALAFPPSNRLGSGKAGRMDTVPLVCRVFTGSGTTVTSSTENYADTARLLDALDPRINWTQAASETLKALDSLVYFWNRNDLLDTVLLTESGPIFQQFIQAPAETIRLTDTRDSKEGGFGVQPFGTSGWGGVRPDLVYNFTRPTAGDVTKMVEDLFISNGGFGTQPFGSSGFGAFDRFTPVNTVPNAGFGVQPFGTSGWGGREVAP